MPRYEYKCEGCGEIFALQQKCADEPLTVHDKCGAKVERLISAPALQFKGSGWYVNDYAKGGNGVAKKKAEPKSDTKSKSKSKSKSESKTDSKPATASGSKSESKSTESNPASTSS